MRQIHLNLQSSYDVFIGKGLFDKIGDLAPSLFSSFCKTRTLAIVTDGNVAALYLRRLEDALGKCGFETRSFVFPAGENSKNIGTLSDILEFLASAGIRRNDVVVALGGGVVGDMAGFAASVYMRGVQYIQIPTTLLSAVDSSVGGKTAVNFTAGKNLAGAFWQPAEVFCDTDIVGALPDGIFSEEMGEVIKCGVIRSLPFFDWIKAGTVKEHLEDVICECVRLKADIVSQDEFDVKGVRNLLNAGHTAAHAIEKLSGYSVFHGCAVAAGVVLEARLAKALGLCGQETVDVITEAVSVCNLKTDLPWSAEEMTRAMKNDKKNKDSKIVFVLPEKIGKCVQISLQTEDLERLLRDCL